jgi:SAM-dependent methyltransferase
MFGEWLKMWRARSWMRRNRDFLPTWHAYVGYKMKLFDHLEKPLTSIELAARTGLDQQLLESWLDVGIAIGHLLVTDRSATPQTYRAHRKMLRDFRTTGHLPIGELLVEMMELHIPTLLEYPQLLSGARRRQFDEQAYAPTVAATSALIEELAFPKIQKWIRSQGSRSILDIGCGYGGYLLRLARSSSDFHLYGIEKDISLIDGLRATATRERLDSLHVQQADFLQLEADVEIEGQHSFDLVMLNNILYYFSPAQRAKLIARAASRLSTGGTMTMISPLRSEQQQQPFAAAFNSFMRAHDNLFDLPTIAEIQADGFGCGLQLVTAHPLIREGNWYFFGLRKADASRND